MPTKTTEQVDNASSVIELKNVVIAYEDLFVINNFSMKVCAGEKVLLTGRNGSGKTSLLFLIAGLISEINGKIIVNEREATDIIFEQNHLFYGSVGQNISADYLSKINLIYELVKELNIQQLVENGNINMNALDMGMSNTDIKKLCLIRMVVNDKKILLFDELFAGINEEDISRITAYINKHFLECVCLFASHEKIQGIDFSQWVNLGD